MYIKKENKKKLIFTAFVLIGTIFIYLFSSFWIANKIISPLNVSRVNTIYGEELYQNRKDFNVIDDSIISESEDPWLIWTPDSPPTYIKIIVDKISKDTSAQIFYANEEEIFTEEKSVHFNLTKGVQKVQLPLEDNFNGKLRLDLTNELDIKISINKIQYSTSPIEIRTIFIIFSILEVLFLTILFLLFFKTSIIKEWYDLWLKIDTQKRSLFLLTLLLSFSCVIIYGKIIIDKKVFIYTDIGGDTLNAYFAFYNYLTDSLRELDFSDWTFFYGLGTSNIKFSIYMADPFSLLVIIISSIFGNEVISYMLLFSHILKIIICGLFCYKYLGFFQISEQAKVIASYIFGFNGFLILWGQHYFFGTFCFWSILILICIENILKYEKGILLLSFVTTLITITSVYCAYMILLFSAVYVLFRLLDDLHKEKIRESIYKALKLVGSVILGLCMSAIMFLPQVHNLLNVTNRLDSSISILEKFIFYLKQFFSKSVIVEYLKQFLSNNLNGIGNGYIGSTNYYEVPQLFFSIFFFIFFMQYFCNIYKRHYNKRQKIIRYFAIILIVLLVFQPTLSMILNGFAYPFGRYTFLLMPLFALVTAITLDDILIRKYINIYALMFSVITIVYLESLQIPKSQEGIIEKLQILNCLLLLIFCGSLLKQKKISYRLLTILIGINLICDSYLTTNARGLLQQQSQIVQEPRGNKDTMDALKYLQQIDSSFYRVEKTYYDNNPVTDSLIQGYYGISTYNSTLNKNIIDFNNNFMKEGDINWFAQFIFSNYPNHLTQYSLLGMKYLLTKRLPQYMQQFEILNKFGDVYVLHNKNIDNPIAFYEYLISRKEFDSLSYIQKLDVYSCAMVVEDEKEKVVPYSEVYKELNYQDITLDCAIRKDQSNISQIMEVLDGEEIIFLSNIGGRNSIYFQFDIECSFDGRISIVADNGNGYLEENVHYEKVSQGREKSIKYLLPENTTSIRINGTSKVFSIKNFKLLELKKSLIPQIQTQELKLDKKEDMLSGTVTAKTDGYLFLPVVYQDGWKAKLDQKPVELIQADAGFIGLKLSQGTHSFCLKYQMPWKKQGAILSLFGVTIWIILLLKEKRKGTRN